MDFKRIFKDIRTIDIDKKIESLGKPTRVIRRKKKGTPEKKKRKNNKQLLFSTFLQIFAAPGRLRDTAVPDKPGFGKENPLLGGGGNLLSPPATF